MRRLRVQEHNHPQPASRFGVIRREMMLNVLFSVGHVIAQLWVVRMAGSCLSREALGVFLLSRRVSATVANGVLLGGSQTIRRYWPVSSDFEKRCHAILVLCMWLGLSALIMGITALFLKPLTRITFPGISVDVWLTGWVSLNIVAIVGEFLACAILTAEGQIVSANLIRLLYFGGVPLSLMYWNRQHSDVVDLVALPAIALGICALGVFGTYLVLLTRRSGASRQCAWKALATAYLSYGVPRGITSTLIMLFFSLGPWFLRAQIASSGYLMIALTLVRMSEVFAVPVTQIASIAVARFMAKNDTEALRGAVRLLFGATAFGAGCALVVVAPWLPALLRLWLGDAALAGAVLPYAKILLWGSVPLAVFQSLKEVVDVLWLRPKNLCALVAALGAQVGGYLLLAPLLGDGPALSVAVVAGLVVMGGCTVFWLRAHIGSLVYYGPGRILGVLLALFCIHTWCASHSGLPAILAACGISGFAIAWALVLTSTGFATEMRRFLWGGTPSR